MEAVTMSLSLGNKYDQIVSNKMPCSHAVELIAILVVTLVLVKTLVVITGQYIYFLMHK